MARPKLSNIMQNKMEKHNDDAKTVSEKEIVEKKKIENNSDETPQKLEPKSTTEKPKKVGRRKKGYEQINALIPRDLRIEVKVKAIREEMEISDVINRLLIQWVEGHIAI